MSAKYAALQGFDPLGKSIVLGTLEPLADAGYCLPVCYTGAGGLVETSPCLQHIQVPEATVLRAGCVGTGGGAEGSSEERCRHRPTARVRAPESRGRETAGLVSYGGMFHQERK